MPRRRDILEFAFRFAVLFGVLVAPWPGFQAGFAQLFQSGIRPLLRAAWPRMLVKVERRLEPKRPSLDTEVLMADADAIRPKGQSPSKFLLLDSRSLGWMPNAMLVALMGATPVRWKPRWKSALVAVAVVNGFVTAAVLAAAGHALCAEGPPSWQCAVLTAAYRVSVENLGASFAFPALVWIGWLIVGTDGRRDT